MEEKNFKITLEKIYGKFIWIIDDFRINFNKIKKIYDDFLLSQTQHAFDRFIKPLTLKDPTIKIVDDTNFTKDQHRELISNSNYTEFEKELYTEKRVFMNKYTSDFIPFQLQFGTQSDFIYRSAFVYIVSMFEGFNHQLIKLFEKFYPEFFYTKKKKRKIKIYYNPQSLNRLFKKQFRITNLKKDFPFFLELKELYAVRNILVHNLGFVNDKFINKIKNTKYQIDQKVEITSLEFNKLVDIILMYLIFIKKIVKIWYKRGHKKQL